MSLRCALGLHALYLDRRRDDMDAWYLACKRCEWQDRVPESVIRGWQLRTPDLIPASSEDPADFAHLLCGQPESTETLTEGYPEPEARMTDLLFS